MRLLPQMMLLFSVADTGRSLLEEGVEGWVLPPYPKKRFIAWDLVDTTLQTTATNVLDCEIRSFPRNNSRKQCAVTLFVCFSRLFCLNATLRY